MAKTKSAKVTYVWGKRTLVLSIIALLKLILWFSPQKNSYILYSKWTSFKKTIIVRKIMKNFPLNQPPQLDEPSCEGHISYCFDEFPTFSIISLVYLCLKRSSG
jgi:hypothetical protein